MLIKGSVHGEAGRHVSCVTCEWCVVVDQWGYIRQSPWRPNLSSPSSLSGESIHRAHGNSALNPKSTR